MKMKNGPGLACCAPGHCVLGCHVCMITILRNPEKWRLPRIRNIFDKFCKNTGSTL